ncbi:MAG: hypothetical protein KBF83_04055 [Pyrinomonadaceae bacterium]|nr:hypothetical protein [Pyrinomonadaceae bacterium]
MKRCPERRRVHYDDTWMCALMKSSFVRIWVLLIFVSPIPAIAQQASQNPSPMTDTTRPHPRIAKVEVPGRRTDLAALKGAVLFAGPKIKTDKPVPLIIHFHGVPWLMEYHVAKHFPKAALITVNLGSGSRVYGDPFVQAEMFHNLIDEAAKAVGTKKGWSSITLVGFSAGYGAIRAILRHGQYFQLVNNVLLLDGIHASYIPEGKRLADGGVIKEDDLDSYIKFAREAVAGNKRFLISHSEIFPGTYASTTECVDHLLSTLGIRRRAKLKNGPVGMQQTSEVDVKGFHIRGYAGNTGADHGDQLQAMPDWLKALKIK